MHAMRKMLRFRISTDKRASSDHRIAATERASRTFLGLLSSGSRSENVKTFPVIR